VSLRSWWSWILEPWRSVGVAVALVGALSLPALLLSAGSMFEAAASDEVARRFVDELEPGPAGITLSTRGSSSASVSDPFTVALEQRLAALDALAVPLRTVITDPLPLAPVLSGGPGTGEVAGGGRAPTGRLFARPGAIEALEVISGTTAAPGVWITRTLAEDLQLGPGASILVDGLADPVPVAGVYRDLWETEPNEYWRSVPSSYVPRFLRVFNSPEFELIVVPEELMGELGPSARLVWEAPVDRPPPTWDRLVEVTDGIRRLERDLAVDTDLGDLHRRLAADPDVPPTVFTVLGEARSAAARVIDDFEGPIATATLAGAAAGLALSSLGAVFIVRRRRTEYRLLAADGESWWRFLVRAEVQYIVPALAGVLGGVAIGWLSVTALGPSGTADLGVVPWALILGVSVIACLLAGVVTASLAVRTVEGMNVDSGRLGGSWLLVLGGAAVAMWVQVGERVPGEEVGPLVVAFPFVGIVTGVVLVVLALRLVLRAARRTGSRLPTPLFLAWRAITGSETGALLATSALGLAAGLAVLSTVFVSSVDTAIADKAATIVGSQTQLDLADRADPATLPADTTIARVQSTRASGTSVRVIAVDPATFASAVAWRPSFGSSPEEVLEMLGAPIDGAVPAVVVGGGEVPESGEFGVQRVFPYRVVAELASFPLASTTGPTLVVRTDRFDEIARQRFEDGLDELSPADRLAAEALGEEPRFESPLEGFGHRVVSHRPSDELLRVAEDAGLVVRGVSTLAEESNRVGNLSTRWAFDFLRILAAIGALTALVAMALFLSERRRERAIAAIMVDQMGIPRRTNIAAAVVEMVGLLAVALTAGTVSAVLVAWRAFPWFEPDPGTPPSTGLQVEPFDVALMIVLAVVAVAATAAVAQHSAASAARSRVFRG
jgi:hypothetical protein